MMLAALLSLTALPAASTVPAVIGASQTLEALTAQGIRDPASEPRSEDAVRRAGEAMDGSPFHIRTLAPVDHVPLEAIRRVEDPGPVVERPAPSRAPVAAVPVETPPAVPAPGRSPTDRYYFEGKSPVQGITIYSAKPDLAGDGRTRTDGSGSPYGKYGTYALLGGAALAVGAFVVGGPVGLALGIAAGVALGAGLLISLLFKK